MQSAKLLKDNVFINLNIKVDVHSSLNTCKVVTRSHDLISWTEDDILGGFRDQSVTNVMRVYIFEMVRRDCLAHLILKFDLRIYARTQSNCG